MEIILQWLDELDDLIFAGLSLWRRLRQLSLAVAAAAALTLVAIASFGRLPTLPVVELAALLSLAVGALFGWALLSVIYRSAASSRHSRAGDA